MSREACWLCGHAGPLVPAAPIGGKPSTASKCEDREACFYRCRALDHARDAAAPATTPPEACLACNGAARCPHCDGTGDAACPGCGGALVCPFCCGYDLPATTPPAPPAAP